jgi:hypothetical protein
MDDPLYILEEYTTERGKIPFREWLRSLRDVQARARIRVRLNRVRLGNFGDAKPVGDGAYMNCVSRTALDIASIMPVQGSASFCCCAAATSHRKNGT